MKNIAPKEITQLFKTNGTPTITYVRRNNGLFEKRLRTSLDNKGQIVLITGPSKTGKSSLFRNVLNEAKLAPIIVRSDHTRSSDAIWRSALEEAGAVRITNDSSTDTSDARLAVEGEYEIGWNLLARVLGRGRLEGGLQHAATQIRETVLADPSPSHLVPLLKQSQRILVLEDFHYLNEETQKTIFQQWKIFCDEGISVIVIGTTHHIIDIANSNKDLVGRTTHLEAGNWSNEDVSQIFFRGFQFINAHLSTELIQTLARECVGLPIIAQQIWSAAPD